VPTSAALSKRSILIIDDDTSARAALAALVEMQGYLAFEAKDGQAAVEYLAASASPPKLILLDLDMPVMNGREFLSKLPLLQLGSSPTVIVITGQDPNAVQGAAAVLRKPVAVAQLLGLMHRLAPLPEKQHDKPA